jgi:hypothetical protein
MILSVIASPPRRTWQSDAPHRPERIDESHKPCKEVLCSAQDGMLSQATSASLRNDVKKSFNLDIIKTSCRISPFSLLRSLRKFLTIYIFLSNIKLTLQCRQDNCIIVILGLKYDFSTKLNQTIRHSHHL